MKIRQKKEKYTYTQLSILLVLVIEAQFFYILKLPRIFWLGNNPDNKSYIIIILYLCIFFYLLNRHFIIRKNYYFSFLKIYLPVQVFISFILIFRSAILYNQSMFSMTQCADYLFMPFTVIVFLIAFTQKNGFHKIMQMIFWFVFICQIVIFIQGILYFGTGIQFCFGMRETATLELRAGVLRSARYSVNFIGIGYALNNLVNTNKLLVKRNMNILMLTISSVNLLFFNGFRTIVLSTFAMMTIIVFCSKKIGLRKKVLLFVLIIIVLFGFDVLNKFINSFSMTGELSGSTSVRMGSFSFYWDRVKNNPILGYGMIRPYSPKTWKLFGGLRGYVVTDAGIVGALSEIGFLGVMLYVILFIRGIYITTKVKTDSNRPFLIGILLYILISAPSMFIIQISRCLAVPICMAIFEYVYFSSNQ